MKPKYFSLVATTIVVAFTGCTHVQLRMNSVRQANTVSDIYEQQVMDNLAKFAVNPYATPSFSVASQATNGVQDQGEFGISDGGFVGRFWANVSASGSRGIDENFTLDPVTNPQRLRLMQCAYQRAVGVEWDECENCCELLAAWTGDPATCCDPCWITSGWVCKSDCRKDVPKDCCDKFGKYCGKYVWVKPCYQKEFSKLVLAIIDYAAGEPSPGPDLKEVSFYLNESGLLTPKGTHSQEVHAIVPAVGNQQEIMNDLQIPQTLMLTPSKEQTKTEIKDASDLESLERLIPKIRNFLSESEISEDMKITDFQKLKSRLIEDIDSSSAVPYSLPAAPTSPRQRIPNINFGPPAQFNIPFGVDVLKRQQRLNTVPFSRRN